MTTEHQPDRGCSLTRSESPSGAEPDGWLWKTSQDYSAATLGETLLLWLERWLGYGLTYQAADGEPPAWSRDRSGWSSGGFWTRSMCEHNLTLEPSLKDEGVCSLFEILETGEIDPRYYLSARACADILRRAERRGKELPATFRRALEAVVREGTGSETHEAKIQ